MLSLFSQRRITIRRRRLRIEALEGRHLLAAILTVDIDSNRGPVQFQNPSPTEPGFEGFTVGPSLDTPIAGGENPKTFTTIVANITKVGNGNLNPRDREIANWAGNPVQCLPCPSFAGVPEGDMFRDFIQADGSTDAHGLNLELSGLTADTDYALRLWSYDPLGPGNRFDVVDALNGVPLFSNFAVESSLPANRDDSSIDVQVTSSSNGIISVSMIRDASGPGDSVPLNGFELSSPSTDIVATDLDWVPGGVEFSYAINDADLPQSTTAAFYWADGDTLNDVISGPFYNATIQQVQGSYGPITVAVGSTIPDPPPGATHLLLMLDPPSNLTDPIGTDLIDESHEGNNLKSLVLPDIVVTGLSIDASSVNFEWEIKDADLPNDTTVELYWSDDAMFDPGSDALAFSRIITGNDLKVDTYSDSVRVSAVNSQRNGLRQLLLVVDPPSSADPNGRIDESRENNNVLAEDPADLYVFFHGGGFTFLGNAGGLVTLRSRVHTALPDAILSPVFTFDLNTVFPGVQVAIARIALRLFLNANGATANDSVALIGHS